MLQAEQMHKVTSNHFVDLSWSIKKVILSIISLSLNWPLVDSWHKYSLFSAGYVSPCLIRPAKSIVKSFSECSSFFSVYCIVWYDARNHEPCNSLHKVYQHSWAFSKSDILRYVVLYFVPIFKCHQVFLLVPTK